MKLLKDLCLAFAPSGDEGKVIKIISEKMAPLCDEITTDAMGNLICHKKGSGKRLMLTAPVDSAGLMVTHVGENGLLSFAPFGDISSEHLIFRFVVSNNGEKAALVGSCKASSRSDLYLDPGKNTNFKVGSLFTAEPYFAEESGLVSSPFLSSRAAAYALINAASSLHSDNDIYFVFASQSKVGSRGAVAAGKALCPDEILAVGSVSADEAPIGNGRIKIGKGPAVSVSDKSAMTSPSLRKALTELLSHTQLSVTDTVDSDLGAALYSGKGALAGALLIPVRYKSTPAETAEINDINEATAAIRAFAERR